MLTVTYCAAEHMAYTLSEHQLPDDVVLRGGNQVAAKSANKSVRKLPSITQMGFGQPNRGVGPNQKRRVEAAV